MTKSWKDWEVEKEPEETHASSNFYKLKSESLEAEVIRLRQEKTWLEAQRTGFLDRNIALQADNELLKKEIKAAAIVLIEQQGRLNALEYQGQDKR